MSVWLKKAYCWKPTMLFRVPLYEFTAEELRCWNIFETFFTLIFVVKLLVLMSVPIQIPLLVFPVLVWLHPELAVYAQLTSEFLWKVTLRIF